MKYFYMIIRIQSYSIETLQTCSENRGRPRPREWEGPIASDGRDLVFGTGLLRPDDNHSL